MLLSSPPDRSQTCTQALFFAAAFVLGAPFLFLSLSLSAAAAEPLIEASTATAEPGSMASPAMTPEGTTQGEPLRIGATISETGSLADLGIQVRRGLVMWQAGVNERGGLLGRAVELVLRDDRSDAATAAQHYRQMRESGINLFVSPYSSEMTLAVRDVVGRDDIAMVSIASAPQIWQTNDSRIFGAYTPANQNMDPFLHMVAKRGLSTVALAYQDSEFPRAVAEGVRAKAAELELNIVLDQSYSEEIKNWAPLAQAIRDTKPDAIIVGSYLQDAIEFTKAAKAKGVTAKLIAFSGGPALRQYGNAVGAEIAEGVISTVQWLRSVRMPGSFDFGFRYRSQFGVYPSYDAAGGYAAGQILEAALRLAKSAEPIKVRKRLSSMKFRSILGHYRVDENGMQNAKPTYLVQWQDNHISLVYPPQLARWQVVYPLPW